MRWIVWIVAAIGLVAIVVLIVGYSLPKGHSVTRVARVPQPPDTVYALLSDVGRYPACAQRFCAPIGWLVSGSIGSVGCPSHASRLSTTSITPYIRIQWPGKVHR